MEHEKLRALEDAADRASGLLTAARHNYLKGRGWEWTCQTPGCVWMWMRTIPDGRTLLVLTEAQALAFQRELEVA